MSLRRQLLLSLWAASALALATVGIGVTAEAATPADTIVMAATIDDLTTPDPAEGFSETEGEVISNCYDRVLRYEPEDLTKLQGEAVESWAVSADGKTFTFKVRPGQKFHSGNPLRAEDIAFSLQRVIILNKAPAFLLGQLGWTADTVKQLITATDSNTVRLTIVNDYTPDLVLSLLSSSVASIVDEQLVMQHSKDGDFGYAWLKAHDAGSGPYELQSWTPNDSVIYQAYPGYWMGAPAIKHVILKSANEPSVQRLMLEQGDADIARQLGANQIAAIRGNPDIAVSTALVDGLWYLGLNAKEGPLANAKVRQAIRYLIDYQGMADSFLKGEAFVHQSFVPKGVLGALDDTPFHLDVAKAKALLAEAGYPDGFAIRLDSFNYAPFTEISQSIQQTLAQGGIKVDLVLDDHKLLRSIYRARKHEIVTQRWASDYTDPHSNALWFAYNADNSTGAKSKSLTWRNSWFDADLNRQTDAARMERDPEKRIALYRAIQEKIRDEGPFVFLFQFNKVAAMRANVKGFVQGPTYDATFYRLMTK